MEALKIANSLPMWLACGVAVVLVIAQALIFIKKAMDAAPEVGVTKEQVNKDAWAAFLEMRAAAAKAGIQDMSLDEINAAIQEVRNGR